MPANLPNPSSAAVRDASKSAQEYQQFIDAKRAEIELLSKTAEANPARKAGLLQTFPQKCNDIALALYSAGQPVSECRRALSEAVDWRLRFLEASGYRLEEYGLANEDLRTFSGAYLLDRQREMVEAHQRTKFDTNPVPGLIDLMEMYGALLLGESLEKKKVDEKSLKKVAADWLTLIPLFQSVARRDQGDFAAKLENYLASSWDKYAAGLKRAAKNPSPIYFGTWNLLSAALSKAMGSVPELSKKTRPYLPLELVTA